MEVKFRNDQVVFGYPIEGYEGCFVVIPPMKKPEKRLRKFVI